SGTASRTGATLRHDAPFGRPDEHLVAYVQYYVNGDYRMRAFVTGDGLLGTPLRGKLAVGMNRLENALFFQPDVNTAYVYSNHSPSYESQLDAPLPWLPVDGLYARAGFTLRNNRYGEAPPALAGQGSNVLASDFFRDEDGVLDPRGTYRGLNQDFLDRIWHLGVVRDTRNNENIP